MQAVKSKIEAWAERKNILGELQNGFRVDRRLDDNLFVLTQCIEISKIESRQLYVAFLDITGAYDKERYLYRRIRKFYGKYWKWT